MTNVPNNTTEQEEPQTEPQLEVDEPNKPPEAKEASLKPGVLERATQRYMSEFEAYINQWAKDERIDEETKNEILTSLKNPEAKNYLTLVIELQIVCSTVRSEITTAIGTAIFGDPFTGFLAGEAFRDVLKYVTVQLRGKHLSPKEKQVLAALTAVPHAGIRLPLVRLVQKHRALVKYFYVFLRMRTVANMTKKYATLGEDAPNKLRIFERISLSLATKKNKMKATPEDLAAIEEERFKKIAGLSEDLVGQDKEGSPITGPQIANATNNEQPI